MKLAAIDSTGYESGHTSAYFGRRSGLVKHHFPKLGVLSDVRTNLILAADVSIGPWPDDPHFEPLVRRGYERVPFDTVLADAGYDSEKAHVLVREELGAKSVIPPKRGRPTDKGPRGRYRRMMWKRFPKKRYGQRWQVESLFSQDKRRFGSQIAASSTKGQLGELLLRVMMHNIAILLRLKTPSTAILPRATVFNRASQTPFPPSSFGSLLAREDDLYLLDPSLWRGVGGVHGYGVLVLVVELDGGLQGYLHLLAAEGE